MDGLEKAMGDLARLTDRWMRTTSLAAQGFPLDSGAPGMAAGAPVAVVPVGAAPAPVRLEEVTAFGDNPGALRLFQYRPAELAADPALVVVLHGCTQTAAAYDAGSGWSRQAERGGFVVLYPEQQAGNNPKTCFNWYSRRDTAPGRGEAGSIRAMIDWAMRTHGIAPGRVFITGLSAGAAMAVAMMALHPDLFAAGAVIAGMPFRAATTVSSALLAMFEGRERTARDWGDLVRGASDHAGPWPRISIWQGDADPVVVPVNARELLKQWLDVHGLDAAAGQPGLVAGHPHRVWTGPDGRPVIETWTIAGMGHGTPVDSRRPDGGVAGPFMLEAGLSSTAHIAAFFGLADARAGRAADGPPAVAGPVLLLPPPGARGQPAEVPPVPAAASGPAAAPTREGALPEAARLPGADALPPAGAVPVSPLPVSLLPASLPAGGAGADPARQPVVPVPAVAEAGPLADGGEVSPAGAAAEGRAAGDGAWVVAEESAADQPPVVLALPGPLARLQAGIRSRARNLGAWARDVTDRIRRGGR